MEQGCQSRPPGRSNPLFGIAAPREGHAALTRTGCYRPCKVAQMWPLKGAHFRARGARGVGGWTRGRGVVRGWLGILAVSIQRRRRSDREREAGALATLSGAGDAEGGDRPASEDLGPRPQRASKLDPYKGIIDTRLAEYPKLSAVRLFNEVQAAGYPGGYGQVKRYVREVRPQEPCGAGPEVRDPPGATRARWTSRTSGCRGASGTP